MDDARSRLEELLNRITDNQEYISGILDNAPHDEDREYMYQYILRNPNMTISDIILLSAELGMIRDGELEPLSDNNNRDRPG